jgi:DNA (cytosine-5)-methyltransferase 1
MAIQQGAYAGLRELALFAGAGGGILGGHLLGWRTVCAVERDAYAAQVLAQRQNDGALRPFPIWSDVQTFDGRPWQGRVDVVSGGFPCQDISVAGKGAGIDGSRSGMWTHMARVVGEVRPRLVFVENSPALVHRGLGRVLGDLAELRYDARWAVVGAADVGAPHQRDRIWIVGSDAMRDGCEADHRWEPVRDGDGNYPSPATGRKVKQSRSGGCGGSVADTDSHDEQWRRGPVQVGRLSFPGQAENDGDSRRIEWGAEPDVGRVAHGVASRVDRLKALGNGQVPLCAATAFRILSAAFG